MTNHFYVSALNVYPVKSLRGVVLEKMVLDDRGAQGDRRFMLVDAQGQFLTQRQIASMALVNADIEDGVLVLRSQNQTQLRVESALSGAAVRVQVWQDEVEALDMGEEAAAWLSRQFDRDVRLVKMPSSTRRQVDPDYATGQDLVSFADGFPLLLISQSALVDLNSRMQQSVTMARFRPNIVVSGCTAFAEDGWKRLRIGDLEFAVAKPCSRCVIPSIDPRNGEKNSEIIRTLAAYRRAEDGKTYFGQNLLFDRSYNGSGVISVGDRVEVLE